MSIVASDTKQQQLDQSSSGKQDTLQYKVYLTSDGCKESALSRRTLQIDELYLLLSLSISEEVLAVHRRFVVVAAFPWKALVMGLKIHLEIVSKHGILSHSHCLYVTERTPHYNIFCRSEWLLLNGSLCRVCVELL